MQQVQQGMAIYHPCSPPSEGDWLAYKTIIKSLYIKDDLTLENIRGLMLARYGFKASNKMYKTRFKRWKLQKYVSACDKEAVAQLLDVYRRKGLEPPDVVLGGKRVPLHVVRRYCRRNRIFNETCDRLPYMPDSATSQIDDLEEPAELWASPSADGDDDSLMNLCRSPLSMNNLSLTSELDQTQLILALTSQYFHWHFSGHDISSDHLTNSSDYANCSNVAHLTDPVVCYRQIHRGAMSVTVKSFFNRIGQVLDLMVADEQQRAWQAVHEACDMVKAVFYDQHRSLLKMIYRAFSDARWVNNSFAGLRSCLFRHLALMSGEVLGPKHPLSMILRLCQNPTVFRCSSYQVFNVILDSSIPYVGAYGPEIPGLRRAHCETLMMNSEYDTAETETRKLIAELESRIGPNHYDTRRTLRRLAQIYVQQHLYEPTLAVYFDEIQRARIELGDAFPDESCLVTYHKIAYIFNEFGDIVSAEKYWRLAHEKPVSLWHCPSTARHFGHHLKDMLSLQANLKRKGRSPKDNGQGQYLNTQKRKSNINGRPAAVVNSVQAVPREKATSLPLSSSTFFRKFQADANSELTRSLHRTRKDALEKIWSASCSSWPVSADSKFIIKGIEWNIIDLPKGSMYAYMFGGEVLTHAFLNTYGYHRLRAPVDGKAVEARVIQGQVYLETKVVSTNGQKSLQAVRRMTGQNTTSFSPQTVDAPDELGYQFV